VESRYVLCGEIGVGGMASVHLGRLVGSAAFARTVAIKRLLPRYAEQPEFRLMLIDEARLAARVRHPNVVQTLEVVANADELLLVMEYVDGVSLGRLLRAGAVPEPILAALVCQVLDGLHAAHVATDEHGAALQIVHRDISPENILVGADGFARILDFGIAKARSRLHETRDGAIKGKLAYMAPEQIAGKATQQSDVFATSVVLWEGLMGRRLFQADSDGEIIGLVLATVVEPPDGLLGAIAVRGLARAPTERWANARAMAEAIRAEVALATHAQIGAWVEASEPVWLAERRALVRETEATSLDAAPQPEISAIGDFIPTTDDVRRPQRRSRVGVIVGGAVAALAVGVIALVALGASHKPADDAPASSERPIVTPTIGAAIVDPTPQPTVPEHARPATHSPAPKQQAARPANHNKPAARECDPPYRLGPLGEKQWLKQCL
jgi:eukaryotic-like serine/threonine-protein kinase